MQKLYVTLFSLIVAIPLILTQSCKKSSGSNINGNLVETPYTLYFTDSAGTLFHTNDGKTYTVVTPADGSPAWALAVSGNNILVVKPYLGLPGAHVPIGYFSDNNGKNFNTTLTYIQSLESITVISDVFHNSINLNQSLIIVPQGWGTVYVASNLPDTFNFFGVVWNMYDGSPTFWHPAKYFDTTEITNPHNMLVTSFTQIKSGSLVAFDGIHQRNFIKEKPDSNYRIKEVFANWTNKLPDTSTSFFSAGHLNNQLIMIDRKGNKGAYYSDDLGVNWYQYPGLPASTPLLCIASPFEQICLVGSDKRGLYLLNTNISQFEDVGGGLPQGLSVRNIAFKENILKNGTHEQYIYLATSQGIYQSVDMGHNWVRTIPGNFVTIY